MRNLRSLSVVSLLSFLAPVLVTAAGVFPDVKDGHPFKVEIESLTKAGIVKGNPDGNFYPDRQINRAEFLKLLYIATNRTPKAVHSNCFPDVEKGSWYEVYVCDAASRENAFVKGYDDGKFRPGNPVSRTEALKMTFALFGLPAPDFTSADKEIIKFVDVSVAAWYTKYISAAYKVGILPVYGIGGTRFYPDSAISRGEAATFIYNAMNKRVSSSSSSVMSSSSSVSTAMEKNVVFPFTDTGIFTAKKTISYLFVLNSKTQLSLSVKTTGNIPSDVTCRLYLIDDDGFSSEYYLGVQDVNSCNILVAARPGKYQLQIQPAVADMSYTVNASSGNSDGNDGFIEAMQLGLNSNMDASLEPGDLFDWYRVNVSARGMYTVFVTGDTQCIVYTPKTVDQFGFTGPECGLSYDYAAGDYYIGVGRKAGTSTSSHLKYTIRWH